MPEYVLQIAMQLPVVAFFAFIVLKLQDGFDKKEIQLLANFDAKEERRDKQFTEALEKVSERLDKLTDVMAQIAEVNVRPNLRRR